MSEISAVTMDISKLPEACISHVLSLTSPRDCSISSAVSKAFKSAVDSDTVWVKFLPSDYQDILNRTVGETQFSSKKDLYFRLCDPLLIDGGRMSFQLEKSSGAKCFMISARELSIAWGDTPSYWEWITMSGTRFEEAARLRCVWWLEIRGKIESKMLSENTDYAVYLVYRLNEEAQNLSFPVQETAVRIGAHESKHYVRLDSNVSGARGYWHDLNLLGEMEEMEASDDIRVSSRRNDGWLEIEMGGFFNNSAADNDEIDASLMEIKGGVHKGGLIVLGIEVRPKK